MDPWLILLPVQGAVFALWAYRMFRTLFRLRAHAVRASGKLYPGVGATLAAFRAFVTAQEFALDRRRLAVLTLLLIGLTGAFALSRA